MNEEEQRLAGHFLDLGRRAYERGITLYSDFLSLNELNIFESVRPGLSHIDTESYGGYDEAERRIAVFRAGAPVFCTDYPVSCIEIRPLREKFSDRLSHRDYLGAVLNLGIERSCIGDIPVEEDGAYIFCLDRMADFVCENLTRVKHTSVTASVIDADGFKYSQRYQEICGTAASVRLDKLVSLAFSESRGRAAGLIEGGKVFVNGRLVTSCDFHPAAGALISVRGMGKFRYDRTSGTSKKGRERIRLLKYI